MNYFASIASSHEYIEKLQETINETVAEINKQGVERTDIIKLVFYKLELCNQHLERSRKLLKDLERLEKLLCQQNKNSATAS